jgi:hypothetical protein
LFESIGTVAAAILATVPPAEEVSAGENKHALLDVIIVFLNQLFYFIPIIPHIYRKN